MELTRQLANGIISMVHRALERMIADYGRQREEDEERWVTGKTLGEYIEVFSKSWLDEWGETLPRTRATIEGADGGTTESRWMYPLHKIERMLWSGEIKRLKQERRSA